MSILSDTLYSDSQTVVDAAADLLESTIPTSDDKILSKIRMIQVRYIVGVDAETFATKFSPQQLKIIEANEIASIVDELASAIGLQRFRFVERQKSGTQHICFPRVHSQSLLCIFKEIFMYASI